MKIKYSLFAAFGITILVSLGAFLMIEREKSLERADKKMKSEQIEKALTLASALLNKNHPSRALSTLQEVENEALKDPIFQEQHFNLTLKAANALHDTALLETLFIKQPGLVLLNEEAHLKLAEDALLRRDFEKWDELAQGDSSRFILLQSDKLALEKQGPEALKLLSETNFQDKELETNRLIRLALLNQNEHPSIAWGHLTSALKLDPDSSELHFYRGAFLEHSNQASLAAVEFKEAIKLDPNNPFYKESLVDFYLKQGELEEAYLLLSESLLPPSSDQLWLKALFIHHVYKPIAYDFKAVSPPNGALTPLIRYLLAIPNTHFWSEPLLNSQTHVKALVTEFKEAPWLEVLEQLKEKRIQTAKLTLQKHPEMEALNPALYQALLKTKDAYLPFLLKAKWNEAAIEIASSSPLPIETKTSTLYQLTKAIENNQGLEAAIAFASEQKQSAELRFLIGNLYLKKGNSDDAIKILTPIAKTSGDTGVRSAQIVSNLYLKQGSFALAKEIIESNPTLVHSLKGQEFLAKLALKMQDKLAAEKIYSKIAPESFEAVSYFATKAYQEQDYKAAYRLTKQLLDQYPSHTELKANLEKIVVKIKSEPAAKAPVESPSKSDLGAGISPPPKGNAPASR